MIVFRLLFLIPLIDAILEDDILYDIQWQPAVDAVNDRLIEFVNVRFLLAN